MAPWVASGSVSSPLEEARWDGIGPAPDAEPGVLALPSVRDGSLHTARVLL